jgi:DNA-binding beta-propeller fold protein YncE
VYVTNLQGSSVSQFTVGAGEGLVPKSPATVSAGNFAQGVAVSPSGTGAYVVNRFSDSMSQYNILAGGALSPMTPPSVAGAADQFDYPEYTAVSPDGRSLYVTTFGFAQGVSGLRGTVLQYDVGANGHLSRKTPDMVFGRDGTYAVTVSPDGESVYATNSVSGNVSQYDVGPGGKLSAKSPSAAPAGSVPAAIALSPNGQSAYVVNFFGYTVSQYNVAADGRLVPQTPATVATGHYPDGVAVSPDGRSVYVANSYSGEGVDGTVSQYNVGPGGKLSPKSPATVPAGKGPRGIATSSDGRSVYVTNADGNDLSQYNVGAGGRLFPKSTARVATGPSPVDVAVTPAIPGWEGFVTNQASGCRARVQVPYLDGNQRVTAYTEVFCPNPTRLTIRSRLRSDHTNADVTVAQRGCIGKGSCVVDEPKGFRYFKLTCPKSASRKQSQGYYSDIVLYPGNNAGAATNERSREEFLAPFCAH